MPLFVFATVADVASIVTGLTTIALVGARTTGGAP